MTDSTTTFDDYSPLAYNILRILEDLLMKSVIEGAQHTSIRSLLENMSYMDIA